MITITDAQPAAWQLDRLPDDAISVEQELPPLDREVLGWVSDPDVSIYYCPCVIWRTKGFGDIDQWWSGLPTSFVDLKARRWSVTHWKPIAPTPPVPVSEDAVEAALKAVPDADIFPGQMERALAAAIPHMARRDQGAGAVRVKPLTEEEIVALIHKHFPWKSNPHAADALTYEKSPPMFPQATYDVPRFNTVDFIRAIEARSALIAATPTDQVTALVEARVWNEAADLAGMWETTGPRQDTCLRLAGALRERAKAAAAKAPAPDDTTPVHPTFEQVRTAALDAVEALDDWTNENETMFTGWGDQEVPDGATFWRVKSGQALRALKEIREGYGAPDDTTPANGD